MINIKIFDNVDVSNIKRLVTNLTEDDWCRNTSRQKTFDVHRNTNTIFNTDFPNNWNGIGYPIKHHEPINIELKNEIDNYISMFEKRYNGKVGKSMLISLKPESFIYPHVDEGHYLTSCKRCHLVIQTNDFVHFFAGNEWIVLDEGDCFELNNQSTHSVVNYSNMPRIHLLIDIIPNGVIL